MPRNASGTFSLVSGNPVVSGTLIDATWANNTLNDIANEMTDSLSRSGEGGMLAPLRLTDGVQATPGLGFTNEPGSGLYRAGTNEWWSVAGGAQVQQHTANGAVTRFAAGAVGTPSLSAFGDVNTGLWFPAADTIAASTGGSERLRVDSSGNLLVGTGTAGNARFLVRGPGTTSATASIEGATSGGATRFLVSDDGLCRWYGTSNAETMRLDNAGNLGIGTASPGGYGGYTALAVNNATNGGLIDLMTNGTRHLTLFAGASASTIGTASNTALGFQTNAAERMRLDSSGNLGIGTSSPGARLDVVTGTARWRISNDGSGNIIDEVLDSTGAAYRRAWILTGRWCLLPTTRRWVGLTSPATSASGRVRLRRSCTLTPQLRDMD